MNKIYVEFKWNFFWGVKDLLRRIQRRLKHNVKTNIREIGYDSGRQMAAALRDTRAFDHLVIHCPSGSLLLKSSNNTAAFRRCLPFVLTCPTLYILLIFNAPAILNYLYKPENLSFLLSVLV
jgi:hypothetical protein